MDYRQIVWLASYPKSGNTWLRTFLDAYYLDEIDINSLVCSVTDSTATRSLTGNGEDPTTYPIDIQQLTRPMAMLRLVQQWTANRFADLPLFVKTHNAHMITNGIEWLPLQLTRAVIHIVRDPRDVLPSFAAHMGLDLDAGLEKMESKYNVLKTPGVPSMADLISSWHMHTQSFINADTHNVQTFRYEDMKANPVDTFSKMLEHAGVTPDRDRVRKALEIVQIDKLRAQEASAGFTESSPHAKDQFFGSKHEPLTPKHRHALERRHGRLMKRLDYADFNLRRA